MKKSFKPIFVDEKNYRLLKKQGQAGDSFNNVITQLLVAEDPHNLGVK